MSKQNQLPMSNSVPLRKISQIPKNANQKTKYCFSREYLQVTYRGSFLVHKERKGREKGASMLLNKMPDDGGCPLQTTAANITLGKG